MTEQTEDQFWVQARAEDAAARGKQADPAACNACRNRTAAGKQVKHDECAQRATLLPAPDAPGYELVTGMTEAEVAGLPPRFHVPVFIESSTPKAWVCAVCWGDGWSSRWPCATAVQYGTQVFTPEHEAEAAAKKQAAELTAYRAFDFGDPDGRVSASCDNPEHPTWLRALEDTRGCPWCRTAELEAELAKYVGHEPTIAEEMAHLSNALDAVHLVCNQAEQAAAGAPLPEWVAKVRTAADGLTEASEYPPAFRWAMRMDADDLEGFLAELEEVASGDDDLNTLAAVENTIATWRAIAEAQHAHNTAPGPDTPNDSAS